MAHHVLPGTFGPDHAGRSGGGFPATLRAAARGVGRGSRHGEAEQPEGPSASAARLLMGLQRRKRQNVYQYIQQAEARSDWQESGAGISARRNLGCPRRGWWRCSGGEAAGAGLRGAQRGARTVRARAASDVDGAGAEGIGRTAGPRGERRIESGGEDRGWQRLASWRDTMGSLFYLGTAEGTVSLLFPSRPFPARASLGRRVCHRRLRNPT